MGDGGGGLGDGGGGDGGDDGGGATVHSSWRAPVQSGPCPMAQEPPCPPHSAVHFWLLSVQATVMKPYEPVTRNWPHIAVPPLPDDWLQLAVAPAMLYGVPRRSITVFARPPQLHAYPSVIDLACTAAAECQPLSNMPYVRVACVRSVISIVNAARLSHLSCVQSARELYQPAAKSGWQFPLLEEDVPSRSLRA
eukprot:scaffold104573_cov60-Phaeocystis_antarctica.AAC.1